MSCALAADRVSRDGNCNGSPDQNWIIEPDGTIRRDGKCLDDPRFNTANGARLVIYTRNGGPQPARDIALTGDRRWSRLTAQARMRREAGVRARSAAGP